MYNVVAYNRQTGKEEKVAKFESMKEAQDHIHELKRAMIICIDDEDKLKDLYLFVKLDDGRTVI